MSTLSSFVLDRVWAREGAAGRLVWLALQPLAGLFGIGVRLRRGAYRIGLLRAVKAPIPVISVGNLTVGGVGKTPFALWLAEELLARGRRPAVVLRGYGGSARRPTVVARGGEVLTTVSIAGDEAVMLGKRFRGVVIVSRRRAEGHP